MKWVLVSNQGATLQEYHLMENETCKAVMKYNPLHRSVRISCGNQHRLFFIESTGSLTGKYIFKNEYGMEVGNMSHDKWFGKDGSLMIESTQYTYTIHNDPLAELTVYEGTSHQSLVHCGLHTESNGSVTSFSSPTAGINSNCLLLGLCWYLFLPVTKENRVEHAA
jgi:hypothetical protein